MTIMPTYTVFRVFACTILVLAVAGCGPDAKPVKRKPVKAQYSASDYVKHVALGQLSTPNEDHVDIINIYAGQKNKKSQSQALVILDYKPHRNADTQRILAPVSLNRKQNEFPELLDILNRLDTNGATLYDLRIAKVNIAPSKELKIPYQDNTQSIESALEGQESNLIDRSSALTPVDDIRVQLRLIRFFIEHRFRDAAYIAVDNVKKSLAALPHDKSEDAEKVKALSQELEALESDLRKDLPFTL